MERLQKFAQKLEPDFEVEIDDLVRSNIINTSSALLDAYKRKLSSLTEELDFNNLTGLTIDPLKLMGGSVGEVSTQQLIKKKEVEDGEEWVENTDKKWWKPWTWPQEKGYYRTKYKTVQYVLGDELAQQFFMPIEDSMYTNGENARKYALHQSKRIAKQFNKEFARLDDVLKAKLAELENYATDKEKADERIRESERKLNWLEQIKARVESILEI